MKATQFESRFRLWISFAIYVLGFWAPWLRYGSLATPFTTARLELSGELTHWMTLQAASDAITLLAILLAALGALSRVLGSACPGRAIVGRNPQYLGSLLFALAVAVFMPPSGAAVFLILMVVQTWRLILRDESMSAGSKGVTHSKWSQAVFAELFYIAMAICFAVLAWRYDPTLLIQALLICFGVSLVAQAFAPQFA